MTTHTIRDVDGDAYLGEFMLIYRYTAEESETPDIDVARAQPRNDVDQHRLLSALYDHYQCCDDLKDGDHINTPDGCLFARCIGVDVVRA